MAIAAFLYQGKIAVGMDEFTVYRDIVRAGRFAVSLTRFTKISFGTWDMCIILHSLFFSSLSDKIVVIAHDGVNGHTVRALGLAEAAGMAAV